MFTAGLDQAQRVLYGRPPLRDEFLARAVGGCLTGFLTRASTSSYEEDSLPTHLPGKIQKLKWVSLLRPHSQAPARSLTGLEAAEKETDKAEMEDRQQDEGDTIEVVLYTPRLQEDEYVS
jgi:hypothetical protein